VRYNEEGVWQVLTTGTRGQRSSGVGWATMMNGRQWNELDEKANGTRRCRTGGGMSFSREQPMWGAIYRLEHG
jgi:hypothetical protein